MPCLCCNTHTGRLEQRYFELQERARRLNRHGQLGECQQSRCCVIQNIITLETTGLHVLTRRQLSQALVWSAAAEAQPGAAQPSRNLADAVFRSYTAPHVSSPCSLPGFRSVRSRVMHAFERCAAVARGGADRGQRSSTPGHRSWQMIDVCCWVRRTWSMASWPEEKHTWASQLAGPRCLLLGLQT